MTTADDDYTPRPEVDKDVRAYQVVGNSLLGRIRSGEFRAMGKLPPERELAEIYGVGRAVVRDALVMLEVKGLVVSRQGSGIYITRRAYEIDAGDGDTAPAQQGWDSLPPADPLELLQAGQWLESQLARTAAASLTETDLMQIDQAHQDFRQSNFGEARESLDAAFHLAVARAAQNLELANLVSQLWLRREGSPVWKALYAASTAPRINEAWVRDQERLVEALRQRDPDAAYVAMWQHVENLKGIVLGLTQEGDDSRPAGRRRLKQTA